jgi:hypothetical protein
MARHYPGDCVVDRRPGQIRLGRKSPGLGHDSPKHGKKYKETGRIEIFCINILHSRFAIMKGGEDYVVRITG